MRIGGGINAWSLLFKRNIGPLSPQHSRIGVALPEMPGMDTSVEHALNLDARRMHAVQTAANGVINRDTIFRFTQERDAVWASYAGGRIVRGFLVGMVQGDQLTFHYCQLETGGTLNSGHSRCALQRTADGLMQIIEHFEWASGAGTGMNIIQEIPAWAEPKGTCLDS